MPRILTGKVVSAKMQRTVIVQITSSRPHPIYKKLVRRDTRLKADSTGQEVKVGDQVRIIKTRPISRDKHFKLLEVVKK
ncbi:30S ribosomal protein S17 [Candidatus Microgenomates bacterium]|nr:30S ribosomal protein S17 [Candidatus Microgenomates bacterium]MBI2622175.1 30S ribosomal protein S17 [Candidatus Microgenomates bacterium]